MHILGVLHFLLAGIVVNCLARFFSALYNTIKLYGDRPAFSRVGYSVQAQHTLYHSCRADYDRIASARRLRE